MPSVTRWWPTSHAAPSGPSTHRHERLTFKLGLDRCQVALPAGSHEPDKKWTGKREQAVGNQLGFQINQTALGSRANLSHQPRAEPRTGAARYPQPWPLVVEILDNRVADTFEACAVCAACSKRTFSQRFDLQERLVPFQFPPQVGQAVEGYFGRAVDLDGVSYDGGGCMRRWVSHWILWFSRLPPA